MEQFLQVGVISSTHGIRGEVKVFPTTDDAARFKSLKQVILDTGKEHILMEIQGVKFFKQFVIVKFKGIDDINDVEKYKGKSLLVSREAVSYTHLSMWLINLVENLLSVTRIENGTMELNLQGEIVEDVIEEALHQDVYKRQG